MHWIAWVFVANIGVFFVEYIYRSAKFSSFLVAFPYIAVPILLCQIGLFYGFKSAPSLFYAGAIFTVINVGFRLVNSFVLGETLNTYNYIGIALLLIATILIKIK